MCVIPHALSHPLLPPCLAQASRKGDLSTEDNTTFLLIYAMWGLLGVFFTVIRAVFVATFRIAAARTLHERLIQRILKAPVAFFDTTPIGASALLQ